MFVRNEKSIKDFLKFYPIVSIIIIINLLLWIIVDLFHLEIGKVIYNWGIGHNIAVYHGQCWRLITPIFLHANLSHVVFNSFALVLFAPALEQMLGRVRFILFYFLTGIIGNVGTFIINPVSIIPHLGASGAIYGLFGIYMFMVYFRKHLIDKANSQIVTIVFVIGLVMTFIQPNINIAAHIFGFVGGFAFASLFLTRVQRFSMTRNYTRYADRDDEDIHFDPNRWKKRRYRPNFKGKNIFWIIFIILVMIGFISRYFPF